MDRLTVVSSTIISSSLKALHIVSMYQTPPPLQADRPSPKVCKGSRRATECASGSGRATERIMSTSRRRPAAHPVPCTPPASPPPPPPPPRPPTRGLHSSTLELNLSNSGTHS